jgi:hypothetical protein
LSVTDDIAAAVGELQTVFPNTATIDGVVVPVTTGLAVMLGEEYGPGGINATQAVALYYLIDGNPVPAIGQHLLFKDYTYRVESIRQLSTTWVVEAMQVIA